MISFTAYGIPAPKGSMKAYMPKGARFPVVIHDNKHTRPWALNIKWAAKQAAVGDIIPYPSEPMSLFIAFYMPRPKSIPKRVQQHTRKPDADKLLRAALDALTGIIWKDDAQVVRICAEKKYTVGDMPRAEFRIMSVDEERGSFSLWKDVNYPETEERMLL